MTCEYHPIDGGAERYTGELSRYGIDIGYTSDARLIWGVFAPTSDVATGSLEGDYGGVSAAATEASASAPTYWSAASTVRSPCNRFRLKATPASPLLPAPA